MTALEDRLRSELRAEAGLIAPESITGLRLPPPAGSPAGRLATRPVTGLRRGGARHWRGLVIPAAAAAAVAAVVLGTFAVTRALPGAPPHPSTPPAGPVLPAYYAASVPGDVYRSRNSSVSSSVEGRHLAIRATATGKLLATISPPGRYNNFTLLSAAAGGHVFAAGAQWLRNNGPRSSPRLAGLDETTPMRFIVVRVTPAGQVSVSGLSLPRRVSPDQMPSIALSPDGSRLAVAYGGSGQAAVVQVITLATGQVRQWESRVPWTPVVAGMGAWTADGRFLAVTEADPGGFAPRGSYDPPLTTRVRLLDTAAPGTRLTAGTMLTLRAPAGQIAPQQLILTPGGATILGTVTVPVPNGMYLPHGRISGKIAVYSARSGALLRTEAAWVWRFPSPPGRGGQPQQLIAWSSASGSRLVLLQPSSDLNVLGELTGNTFTAPRGTLLPQRPAAYQALQSVLRHAALVAW